jgi:hypothetical protein
MAPQNNCKLLGMRAFGHRVSVVHWHRVRRALRTVLCLCYRMDLTEIWAESRFTAAHHRMPRQSRPRSSRMFRCWGPSRICNNSGSPILGTKQQHTKRACTEPMASRCGRHDRNLRPVTPAAGNSVNASVQPRSTQDTAGEQPVG